MTSRLATFIPDPDVREQRSLIVKAPQRAVYQAVYDFDMQSPWLIRLIIGMRKLLLRSGSFERPAKKFIIEMLALGWAILDEIPGEYFVGGAYCEPWQSDVVFNPLTADQFLSFSEPGQVKIAWTIECEETGPEETRLTTETRAVATDDEARVRFLRYWRWARFGVVAIRWGHAAGNSTIG